MKEHRPLGWTTIEEARMLVEAGLDPNTADMRYEENNYEILDEWVAYPFGGDIKNFDVLKKEFPDSVFYPCWSLGALIDMMPMFEYNRIKIPFGAHVVSTGEIVLQYFTADTGESIVAKKGKEFIDAVISMILWLLANNHIKKHE